MISFLVEKFVTVVFVALGVVLFGWIFPGVYLALEDALFRLMLGPELIRTRLRRIAREDYTLLVKQYEDDRGVTRYFARTVAVFDRITQLYRLLRELRDLMRAKRGDLYRGLIMRMRYAWLDGLQTSVILDQMNILKRLPPVTKDDLDLEASTMIANLTYLLGDLRNGRQLAEENMMRARERDGNAIPRNQWRAAYAYCNSQLFLGDFDEAATDLGQRWKYDYEKLNHDFRNQLHQEFRVLLLDPIASVPRHMILAAAFKGQAIRTDDTRQTLYEVPKGLPPEEQWIQGWYTAGIDLCERSEEGKPEDEKTKIGLHFTHAYMALYRAAVPGGAANDEVLKILEQIPPTAKIVALYAKHAVRGIYYFSISSPMEPGDANLKSALSDLRAADAYSRMSGNRFLEGVLLPVYAAATARSGIYAHPETIRILERAQKHAHLARSPFYHALIAAACATLAYAEGDRAEFARLRRRAENYGKEMPYGFVRIFRLDAHD